MLSCCPLSSAPVLTPLCKMDLPCDTGSRFSVISNEVKNPEDYFYQSPEEFGGCWSEVGVNDEEMGYSTAVTATENRPTPGGSPKRPRKIYADKELEKLENMFSNTPYPIRQHRIALAKELGVSPKNIQVWFQNRRARERLVRQKATGSVENPIERMKHQWSQTPRMPLAQLNSNTNMASTSTFSNYPNIETNINNVKLENVAISWSPAMTSTSTCFAQVSPNINCTHEPVDSTSEVQQETMQSANRSICYGRLRTTSNISDISNSSFTELLKTIDNDCSWDDNLSVSDIENIFES